MALTRPFSCRIRIPYAEALVPCKVPQAAREFWDPPKTLKLETPRAMLPACLRLYVGNSGLSPETRAEFVSFQGLGFGKQCPIVEGPSCKENRSSNKGLRIPSSAGYRGWS